MSGFAHGSAIWAGLNLTHLETTPTHIPPGYQCKLAESGNSSGMLLGTVSFPLLQEQPELDSGYRCRTMVPKLCAKVLCGAKAPQ